MNNSVTITTIIFVAFFVGAIIYGYKAWKKERKQDNEEKSRS